MKRLPKAIILTGALISVFSAAPVTAYAAYHSSTSVRNPSIRSIFISLLSVVIVLILVFVKNKKNGGASGSSGIFKNRSNDFFSLNNSFGSGLNGGNDFIDDRLNEDENLMVQMFQAEIKKKKPDPMSIKCPNCGAPLQISDKTHCPYCRTEILNNNVERSKDPRHDPIPPEEYNPHRYYDENLTGYENGTQDNHFKTDFSNSGFNGYGNGSYGSYNNNGFGGYNGNDRDR